MLPAPAAASAFWDAASREKNNAGPKAGVAWCTATAGGTYSLMSTSLVSRRNSEPITKVITAITIG
ncbi:MAG TPA: hypothetical protein VFR30_11260, partial [Lysobacter sp.]|nr:hypothetical protein [Lysobacter sp.]